MQSTPPLPPPQAESDFWPTKLSREQRVCQKSDPGWGPEFSSLLSGTVNFSSVVLSGLNFYRAFLL